MGKVVLKLAWSTETVINFYIIRRLVIKTFPVPLFHLPKKFTKRYFFLSSYSILASCVGVGNKYQTSRPLHSSLTFITYAKNPYFLLAEKYKFSIVLE